MVKNVEVRVKKIPNDFGRMSDEIARTGGAPIPTMLFTGWTEYIHVVCSWILK